MGNRLAVPLVCALTSAVLPGCGCYTQEMRWGHVNGRWPVSPTQDVAFDRIDGLMDLLAAYREARGRYPLNEEGFSLMVRAGVLPSAPLDPWGRRYVYFLSPQGQPIVTSYGADGLPGGEGENEDLWGHTGPKREWLWP